MPSDSSRDTRRDLVTVAGALVVGALSNPKATSAAQDEGQPPGSKRVIGRDVIIREGDDTPRSRRISEEVTVGKSVARSPAYDATKSYAMIQVIEHVFKEDDDPSAGYPATGVKEFTVDAATKLAIVTISGFEVWIGTSKMESIAASSRYGFHAGLEADFGRNTVTAKVRATGGSGKVGPRMDLEVPCRDPVLR